MTRPKPSDHGQRWRFGRSAGARQSVASTWLRAATRAGAVCAVTGVLSASACSSPNEDSGTNTNWLRRCETDAECGQPASCLCGRCTTGCESSAACIDGLACTEGLPSRVQCGEETLRTCQPRCSADAECESERHCLDGTCVDPLPAECPSGALYCEDFEAESANTIAVVTAGNELSRVQVSAPSGSFALRAAVTAGPSAAYLRAPLDPVRTEGTLFLSGWVRVPTEAAHNVAPLAFWSADEEDWALRIAIQDARVDVWSKTTSLTDSFQLTRGEWYCLGLELSLGNAPDGRVTLTVNDAEVAGATGLDALPEGGIQAVTLGTLWTNSPAEVLVDRVVVSQERVPCF